MSGTRVVLGSFVLALAGSSLAMAQQAAPRISLVREMRIDGNAADLVPIHWLGSSAGADRLSGRPRQQAVRLTRHR